MLELLKMKANRRRNLPHPHFCRRHFHLSTKVEFTENLDPRRSDRHPLQRSIPHHGRHLSNTPRPLARPLPAFNDEPDMAMKHQKPRQISRRSQSTAELV